MINNTESLKKHLSEQIQTGPRPEFRQIIHNYLDNYPKCQKCKLDHIPSEANQLNGLIKDHNNLHSHCGEAESDSLPNLLPDGHAQPPLRQAGQFHPDRHPAYRQYFSEDAP